MSSWLYVLLVFLYAFPSVLLYVFMYVFSAAFLVLRPPRMDGQHVVEPDLHKRDLVGELMEWVVEAFDAKPISELLEAFL